MTPPPAVELRTRAAPDLHAEAPRIGIVVPVLNEAAILPTTLTKLRELAWDCPVVVADGGSSDGSVEIARQFFHVERCPVAGRGPQMNRGARCHDADVLLFLHADSELPTGWQAHIRHALADPRVAGGCFRLEFDVPRPMLRFYSWFTRFPGRFFHFGDQGFFVRREIFWRLGGFREVPFLEDVDFLRRLRRYGEFAVLPAAVRTSARRFLRHGTVRQQLRNIALVVLFELGASPAQLARLYPHSR
ncbi:MAG: TIGR04283 family arsenosugar biosynthesis glycosyltransferase [Firmicutes bacterium]|nr:TIGR04283 family arsenosugar biosynthesis glycosyltransferase [Bacillota bacterium]